jgi:hypothetical protein
VSESRTGAKPDTSAEKKAKHRPRTQQWADNQANARANDKADA